MSDISDDVYWKRHTWFLREVSNLFENSDLLKEVEKHPALHHSNHPLWDKKDWEGDFYLPFNVRRALRIDKIKMMHQAISEIYLVFQAEMTEIKKSQPVRSRPGYVYLVQSPSGLYKIGRTKNPKDRLKTFTVKLPFEVEYICVIQSDNMYILEKQLHDKFKDKRMNGEWFQLDNDDIEYIKNLGT